MVLVYARCVFLVLPGSPCPESIQAVGVANLYATKNSIYLVAGACLSGLNILG